MDTRDLSQLTDQELLEEAKKLRSFSVTNAVLIGFLVGIVVYSIINSTFGFLMLLPLYLAHRLINDPRNKKVKEVELLLKQRNLK
jgi:riboflavin transporter FmnP